MIEQLIQCDKALLVALNGSDSAFLDGVMLAITRTGTWIPLFACLLYAIVRNNRWQRVLLLLVTVALLVTVCDQFASGLCKPFFQRFRPSHDPELAAVIDLVQGYRCGLYGFISSHASNTFGVAVFFSLLLRNRCSTLLLLLYACLSSYSRIYLGVHFPFDILCGALWGAVSGYAIYALSQWVARCFFPVSRRYGSGCTVTGYHISDLKPLYCVFPLTLVYVIVKGLLFALYP